MNFTEFKNGPAASVFAGLGKEWADLLQGTGCFEDLRRAVVIRKAKDTGLFVTAVRRYAGTCSSGEFRLLLAVCTLVDFGHLADDLEGGKAWQEVVIG
jgi:hypothetical protein